MKEVLVSRLACPLSRTPLSVVAFVTETETDADGRSITDVAEGLLTSDAGLAYPIVAGVPRLIEGALDLYPSFRRRWADRLAPFRSSHPRAFDPPSRAFATLMLPTLRRFEQEWSSHDLEDRTWGRDQTARVSHLLHYLGASADDLRDRWLLDAGAGTGQLSCSYATLGGHVVGVDLSPALARVWARRQEWAGRRASSVHLVQGDLMRPPFGDGAFDAAHSSGVLHHTPATRRAFDTLAPLVRRGGVLGVWLYRHAADWRLPVVPGLSSPALSVAWLRTWTPRIPPSLLYTLLYGYAGVFQAAYAANRVLRGRSHDQTVRERVTSLFDTLAPPFVWRHEPAEVASWFREAGYEDVEDTSLPEDVHGFNVRGVRG